MTSEKSKLRPVVCFVVQTGADGDRAEIKGKPDRKSSAEMCLKTQ